MALLFFAIGLSGGILASVLIPSFLFINIGTLISTLVLDPFTFVLGMFCLFIGFIAYSSLLKQCIEQTYAVMKGVKLNPLHVIPSYILACSFFVLFLINISVAAVFLILSFVYGMISLDLKRYMKYEIKQGEI